MVIIEVEKGIVSDVYADNPGIDTVIVVDIDALRVGDIDVSDVEVKSIDEAKKEMAKRIKNGQLNKSVFFKLFGEKLWASLLQDRGD